MMVDEKRMENVASMYHLETVERLDDNLSVIHASCRVKRIARVHRAMVVMRHHKRELTLINPIRLEEAGEKQLLRLGSIERIIRLAPHEGAEHDKYYISKFPQVRRWAPQSSDDQEGPVVHRLITGDDDAILPGCHAFTFWATKDPECALLILQDYVGNLLVTAGALQSQKGNPYVNVVVRAQQMAEGLMEGLVVIPPSWLRRNSDRIPAGKDAIRPDFQRLLGLDFDRLIGASGVVVYQKAKELSVLAIERAFPAW